MNNPEENASDIKIQVSTQLKLENTIRSGANWFFGIAGLSLLNSIILTSGGQISFVAGLGITQVVDALAGVLGDEISPTYRPILSVFHIGLDLFILGSFVVLGIIARKKNRWAFIIGLLLYGLDTFLLLLFQDVLAVGFHLIAGFGIFRGLRAVIELLTLPSEQILDSKEVNQLLSSRPATAPEERRRKLLRFALIIAIPSAIMLLIVLIGIFLL